MKQAKIYFGKLRKKVPKSCNLITSNKAKQKKINNKHKPCQFIQLKEFKSIITQKIAYRY